MDGSQERRKDKQEKKEHLGDLLRGYRLRAGFSTQRELAERIGHKKSTEVSDAELGYVSEGLTRRLIAAIRDRYPLRWDELQDLATAYLFPEEVGGDNAQPDVIGVSVAAIEYSAFWDRFIGAAEREAAKYGFILAVNQHHNDLERQGEYLARLAKKRPLAGLLLAPAYGAREPTKRFERESIDPLFTLAQQGIPVVFIDRKPSVPAPFPCVKADHAHMVQAAVNLLYDKGHRRIGAILGAEHSPAYREQYQGFVSALQAHDLHENGDALDHWLARWVAWGEEPPEHLHESDRVQRGHTAGREVATRMLSQISHEEERPTAIVCGTASLALETLVAIRLMGRKGAAWSVPRKLSLITAETAPMVEWAYPRIAAVDYNLDILAKNAVAKLIAMMRNAKDPGEWSDDPPLTEYRMYEGDSIRALPRSADALRS